MYGFKRTISHWTGGPGRATSLDRTHYHLITEIDGHQVRGKEEPEDNIVTADGDYAAHTLNLNTGSIGLAMACMLNAVEFPLDYGDAPMTEIQFDRHCATLAEVHIRYGIPVTPETCLTHAEVEPRLGVKQEGKWDIAVLPFKPEIRGALAVGDYMRERVIYWIGEIRGEQIVTDDLPILKIGSRGKFVEDLQTQLKQLGYHPGSIDRIFGRNTRKAVLAFQADQDLTTDGIVGPKTRAALERATEAAPQREVTTSDLRKAGSRTIKTQDRVQFASMTTGGVSLAGAVATLRGELKATQEGIEEMSVGVEASGPLTDMMPYFGVALGLALTALAAYTALQAFRAKSARTEDARTGANMRI